MMHHQLALRTYASSLTAPRSMLWQVRVFARDRRAVKIADEKLRDSVGMFCINDKSTGAIIGAHPFGGARSSGTNDKANSVNVLLRFSSIRCVKDTYVSSSSTLSACHVPE
ncbi:unnamed protein product [Aspergillus oryzae]|nr:unnamed protein product [Aspergillus oryzae]